MWGIRLFGSSNAEAIYSCKPWDEYKAPRGTEELLVIEDYVTAFSVFKAVTRTTAGTTIIVTPPAGGSLSITDIILSATKASGATVTLQFEDDTNTEVITTVALTNVPVTFTIPVKGRLQGWRDARLELVTATSSAQTTAFITTGYMRLPNGLEYSEWNALR